MVITPTEAIRRAVIDRYPFPGDRITAIPLAASPHFQPAAVPRGNFFLFLGTIEPRKNVAGLIEAWREVRRKHPVDLVIAGRNRDAFPIPEEAGLTISGPVSEADLPALYSSALAVVYPSLYEGFGLPVLEAMQCGALAVTSRDPAIMEVSGDAALHVEAENTRELTQTLAWIAADPEKFEDVRRRALQRAKCFSWSRTAERTQEVYAEARRVFRK